MDIISKNKKAKAILRRAKGLVTDSDNEGAINELYNILEMEGVDLEIIKDMYEFLADLIEKSGGNGIINAIALLINGHLFDDPFIDMNVSRALHIMESYSTKVPITASMNSRDRVLQWCCTETSEFDRVSLEKIAKDLGIDLSIVEKIVSNAIFDGDITGEYDKIKKELVCLPFEKEKRQLKCIICHDMVAFDDPELVRCKFCNSAAHRSHVMEWIKAAGEKCPRCMSKLELHEGI
ncbi:MAG: PCI domain-containing protein [Candidatus Hodarchaeota archaeon]